MFLALCAHLIAALAAPLIVRALGRRAFLLLALVPASSCVWIASSATRVFTGNATSGSVIEHMQWIPQLGISLALSLDPLSWLMAMIVTGIGALVFLYCAFYFKNTEPGLRRFAAVLTAFAGAMLGLVLADDVMVMFVFWELTTVFSYLLIGHYPEKQASRRAAMSALIVTTVGGLAMLVGLLLLAHLSGSMRLSEIVSSPIWHEPSGVLTTSVVLILAGAMSKSALVPSHFWLPGAMAAPTPVSAYLHAAAMVKAGIYLIVRMAPAAHQVPGFTGLLVALGGATLLVGGWRALRQTDLKLLLAHGTVSQLGLIAMVAGLGTQAATLGASALIVAHALFKAPLFMLVGIVDKKYGTRDLRQLSGVRRRQPVLAVFAVIAAASMAGLPPLLGFVAKEGIYSALWYDGGWHRIVLAVIVIGSAFTCAYAWRFVSGLLGDAPGVCDTCPRASAAGLWILVPPGVLCLLTTMIGLSPSPLEHALAPIAHALPTMHTSGHLALWPGVGVPLGLTVLTIGLGIALCVAARRVEQVQTAVSPSHRPVLGWLDADRVFRSSLRAIDEIALRITARIQRGSLPFALGTALVTLVVLVWFFALSGGISEVKLVAFHSPMGPVVLVLAGAAAIGATRARRRLRAILLVGLTGYMTAVVFLLAGSPDVALTQVLVETLVTVVCMLALRRLPVHFSVRPYTVDRLVRWAIAIGAAVTLTGAALIAASVRAVAPVGPALIDAGYTIGGGKNAVNVTLVDSRVWDTMGELSVLVVVATGVASLIYVTRREQSLTRMVDVARRIKNGHAGSAPRVFRPAGQSAAHSALTTFDVRGREPEGGRWKPWLVASRTLAPERRMVMLEVVTRLAYPLMIVFSLYLLFAGHNRPGGGFAAGLVVGLALTLRYFAGGRIELSEAMPVQAGLLLGTGLALAVLAGLAPLAWGGGVFDSLILEWDMPVYGHVKLVTTLFFDIGVFLVVIGVVVDFLRSLGAQLDREIEGPNPSRERSAADDAATQSMSEPETGQNLSEHVAGQNPLEPATSPKTPAGGNACTPADADSGADGRRTS
ncbi:Na+/H+ antiporter subunit A [Devriesea agamarum]|uniref:Na+/H+ antiporter subunit A n=1 Tax=Devriesea agamarum TaxID=472569 RepID=UPI000A012029|nr:Na+/H+ antiporter subunit A [Devriesea agamarum]